jgi:hypothetical protein
MVEAHSCGPPTAQELPLGRVTALTCFLRSRRGGGLHAGRDRKNSESFVLLSSHGRLTPTVPEGGPFENGSFAPKIILAR